VSVAAMPAPDSENQARILLVADSSRFVQRAYCRYWRRYFAQVLACDSPGAVDVELRRLAITDLICGNSFGDARTSSGLVQRWKAMQSTLQRVVLITGSLDLPDDQDADLVLRKPFDPRRLSEFLFPTGGPRRRQDLSRSLGARFLNGT